MVYAESSSEKLSHALCTRRKSQRDKTALRNSEGCRSASLSTRKFTVKVSWATAFAHRQNQIYTDSMLPLQ